jgi:hypothetical protein
MQIENRNLSVARINRRLQLCYTTKYKVLHNTDCLIHTKLQRKTIVE